MRFDDAIDAFLADRSGNAAPHRSSSCPPGDQDPLTVGLCGWDCLLKYAARFEPPAVIDGGDVLG